MMILQIDIEGLVAIPAEGDAVISAGVDGVGARAIAFPFLKAVTRKIEVLWEPCGIELGQDTPDARFVLDAQFSRIALLGKRAQVWPKVKVPGHAAEVLDAARALP